MANVACSFAVGETNMQNHTKNAMQETFIKLFASLDNKSKIYYNPCYDRTCQDKHQMGLFECIFYYLKTS